MKPWSKRRNLPGRLQNKRDPCKIKFPLFFRQRFYLFLYLHPERKETALCSPIVLKCPGGEIGRRTVFRSQRGKPCEGSNPFLGTFQILDYQHVTSMKNNQGFFLQPF